MGKFILHNLKHFFITFTLLFVLLVVFGVYIGADAHLMQNPLAFKLDGEGPHIFFEDSQLSVKTIRGRHQDGFFVEEAKMPLAETFPISVHFPLEDFNFAVKVNPSSIHIPPVSYNDGEPIVAISDIESGFKAFKDFLIANQVINQQLEWVFGKGHLVLVGDFVDRGDSVTQVLWLIYKLEQEAQVAGGHVHFIIGNHEIKTLQGNYQSASKKYFYIAAMLDKSQQQLYDNNAFIGRWMASKNSVEIINGVLFAHGGIHPQIADYDMSLAEINQTVRAQYRKPFFTRKEPNTSDFLISTDTGPSWYRGYFKDDLSQSDVEKGLSKFNAKAVVVGHTIQSKVSQYYQGKVIAIDVKHPKDYLSSFPFRESEGLLIEDQQYYRLLDDGSKILL